MALRISSGFALVGAVAGTSFEEMVSNVNSQGASWKAAVPTRFGSYDDVKMLCGTIMRGNETFKEMDFEKTNDQQWNGAIPLTCARPGHSARPFLGTSGIRALVVRAGPSAARKPSMTGAASPRARPL